MCQITVFTPTYNRCNLLKKGYEALKRQNNKNFKWLIIDDGSTDDTEKTVQQWIDEKIININYVKQENQGMYAAHNKAYSLIDTELNMCIDSDDYINENAIEEILSFWNKSDKSSAGIIALNVDSDKRIIGTRWAKDLNKTTLYDLYEKHNVKGDKKLIYRTDIINKFSYPVTNEERYIPSSYIYHKIDLENEMILMDKEVCVVCYQDNGMSKFERERLVKCPRNSALYYKDVLYINKGLINKIKNHARYINFMYISKNKKIFKESPEKLITGISIPLAIILYFLIYRKYVENSIKEN